MYRICRNSCWSLSVEISYPVVARLSSFRILRRNDNDDGTIRNVVVPPSKFKPRKFEKFDDDGRKKKKEAGPLAVFMLLVPLSTFGLGVWQTFRRQEKLALIEELKHRAEEEPVELPESPEECAELEYRRVKVRGHFDYSKVLFIGPKSLLDDKEGMGSLISSGSGIGWLVVNPFILADRPDTKILVSRGWIPKNSDFNRVYAAPSKPEVIEVVGIPRRTQSRDQFTPEIKPNTIKWPYRDLNKMAEHLGTLPIYIEADDSLKTPGNPIGNQTRVTLRNDHLSYMFTWFTLSAITGFLWARKYALK